MSDEELSESLAAAVADHASIDWRQSSERLQGAIPSSYGPYRSFPPSARRVVPARCRRSLAQRQVLLGLSLAVATITIGKLALAFVGIVVQWQLVVGRRSALAIESQCVALWHLGHPAHGRQHARPARSGARSALSRHSVGICRSIARCSADAAWTRLASTFTPLYGEAFLALALWQFVWLFPSEPKPQWARLIGKIFLVVSGALGLTLFAANAALGLTTFPRPWRCASSIGRRRRLSTGRCSSRLPPRASPI